MKTEQNQITKIKKMFAEMQCIDDLVNLLNEAKKQLFGDMYRPIQKKQITYYADPKLCENRYNTFTIKKKSGGERIINAPNKGFLSILRALNHVLNTIYNPNAHAFGFVPGKSIVDNAKMHVGHHYVYNIDLKDYFHSFDKKWVKYGFMIPPFSLGKQKEELAFIMASLCTHPLLIDGTIVNVLPQGSPTSPTITNILSAKLDKRLNGLANRFGAVYTRYADDITFSSPHNIYRKKEFKTELERIIKEQKLTINPKKTRLQKKGTRQEVTGLGVNEKANVNPKYIKQIRMWLYYWEKYGYIKAEQIFRRDHIAEKGHVKKPNTELVNVLDGKLEFLKMVKGNEDGTYKTLKGRFDGLISKNDPINKILDIWEKEGIEEAMKAYGIKTHQTNSSKLILIDEFKISIDKA